MLTYWEDLNVYGYTNPKMLFELHGIDIEFKDNDVDIQLVSEHNYNELKRTKVKIYLGIFDNEENQIQKFLDLDPNCLLLTNAIDKTVNDKRIIFHDFLFNRTKAYYTKTGYRNLNNFWYYAGHNCYVLTELDFGLKRNRIFLALNNTYRERMHARPVIMNYLMRYNELGYLGDASNKNLFLTSEGNADPTSHYQPAANVFYNDTYISIYGETIEYGNTLAITEKTFEPLIKGHFILPFSTCGFVAYLKEWGVKFPNFINYEYDTIEDYEYRYIKYHEEMVRLINIPLEQWHQFYIDAKDIISYNRQIFYERPFHKIDFESLLAHSSVG